MQETVRFDDNEDVKSLSGTPESITLTAEVLRRLACHRQGSGGADCSRGNHQTQNGPSGNTAKEKGEQPSFEEFPQFHRCVDAEARRILAYRYLKANRFDVDNAIKMILETNEFRKAHKLDSLLLFPSLIPLRGFNEEHLCTTLHLPVMNADFQTCDENCTNMLNSGGYLNNHRFLRPIFDLINSFYASSIHYWDKEGHPVMYGRLEHVKAKKLYQALWKITPVRQRPENLAALFHLYGNEMLGRVVEYCNIVRPSRGGVETNGLKKCITTATVVIDCMGMCFQDFVQSPFVRIVREMIKLDHKYYPELLERLLLVNCPGGVAFSHWAFSFFGTSKHGLRKKIMCVSERKTPAVLREVIDVDKLPVFLGGACNCILGCVPLNRNTLSAESIVSQHGCPSSSTCGATSEDRNEVLGEVLGDTVSESLNTLQNDDVHYVVVPPREKYILSYDMMSFEDITWEFAVKRGGVKFSAVFIECTEEGRTEVLKPPSTVKEGADHFVFGCHGELILTWDNRRSFFTERKLHVRVHRTPRGERSPSHHPTSRSNSCVQSP
ncbi:hypothetical protein DQ04_08171020 [Trypanosoma grayi]|uniref:hypothetical protein n=1 Tax=Trypanosoma grayi TaxID=71804 RepID=UPI0004F41590|nr:hypothetical protein DQ04_08171020 [Trypanosoma grayi]KEG08035.1 hypothetical protein DQ04_08171020 [Trypanosoma grayi]